MKIKQILQGKIDDWTPEFECTVKEIKETKARTKANRQMSKCIVYDDEEKTGCWIYTDECMVKVGQKLILTGMLKTYNNNFYIDFCKVSRVLAQSTPQNPSQQAPQPQQAKNAPKAVQTDDRNYSFALSYAKDMVCANSLKWIDFWPTVEAFQRYLETGKTPMVKDDEQSSEEDLPANIGEEPKQTLVDESGDEIPF